MYGAIYGDLIGSLYKRDEKQKHDSLRMEKSSNEAILLKDECYIGDDTIFNIAIADALLNDLDYAKKLKEYIIKEQELSRLKNIDNSELLSKEMLAWMENRIKVIHDNKCLSRICPIGLKANSLAGAFYHSTIATKVTHNYYQALRATICIVNLIFLARCNTSKRVIQTLIDNNFQYNYRKTIGYYRNNDKFNTNIEETMEMVLFTFFNTNNFEDAMRLILSFGKNTTVNASIVGGVAEAMYGIDNKLIDQIDTFLPEDYKNIVKKVYRKV